MAVEPPTSKHPTSPPKSIYNEAADAERQIADALAKAKKENRRVLIQWGANWCSWCHLLHGLFQSDADVKRKLQYEYDVVLVDVGRFDKNMDLAETYGAELKAAGIPYLTVLDAEGKVIANQETGSLKASTPDGKDGHDAAKVLALLEEHQAPYLSADTILRQAFGEAKSSGKTVFLHFGAPWCGWCHRLEDWIARPDVAEILAKDFLNVKIDVDRTVGGQELMARYVGPQSGGIPWFAFLTHGGEVVVTSDGPGGNVGFPYQDAEIAHFEQMLRQTARNITFEEIDGLIASLKEGRDGR